MNKLITTALAALLMISASGQEAIQLRKDNIDQVLKAMTPKEKVRLVIGFTQGSNYFGMPTEAPEGAKELVPGAAGQTTLNPRLGIPHTVVADGPAGLRISPTREGSNQKFYCTAFPTGVTLASTWDLDLVQEVAAAMGEEVHEMGVDVLLGPGVNIHRNPLCGRNFEYFSEDPLVAGKMGAAYVKGVQSQGVGVSVKHFAANNQESNRTGNDVVVSQRALREIYLKPFEIIVKEADPWTIMSSYNKINGTYTQESRELLTTILREEWGFSGIVMTDWTRLRNTPAQIKAGNDLMMPGNQEQIDDLDKALTDGRLSLEELDVCVRRILEYIVRTPRFQGYAISEKPDTKAHAALTRQAGADGMVLLKNDACTLPLQKGASIALFGCTSYDFISGGTGSGDVNEEYTVGLYEGLENVGFVPDALIAQLYEDYARLQKSLKESAQNQVHAFYAQPRDPELVLSSSEYEACARRTDVAVITLGRNAGEGADRYVADFYLTEAEQRLLQGVNRAFHAAGKKVVVVINAGGVIETSSWKGLADAILVAWQPGQEAGNSVGDLLCGNVNPSGRLTMSWPLRLEDHLSSRNFPLDYDFTKDRTLTPEQKNAIPNIGTTYYEEDVYVGYRYFQTAGVELAYPFGHGLSYTSFDYGALKLSRKGSTYTAKLTVSNTGAYAGREVVQLYVQPPLGSAPDRPARELKAFAKTPLLQPGETCTVVLSFHADDLAWYDAVSDCFVTEAGEYKALVGSSVADIRQRATFTARASSVQCHDALGIHPSE